PRLVYGSRGNPGGSAIQVGGIQSAFRPKLSKLRESLADAFDQRRLRHRPQVALQSAIVQVVRDSDLPFAEGNELLGGWFHFAQRQMKRRQIDDVATQVVGLGPGV